MIKSVIATALCFLAMTGVAPAHAGNSDMAKSSQTEAHNDSAQPQLLRSQSFNVGEGVSVQLPTVKTADGTVCQSYVASVTRSRGDAHAADMLKVEVAISKVCGKANVGRDGFFGNTQIAAPANLKAMRTVTADGLAFQIPELEVGG